MLGECFASESVLGKQQTASEGNFINKMGKEKEIGYGSMKKLGEGAYEVDYSGLSHLKSLH